MTVGVWDGSMHAEYRSLWQHCRDHAACLAKADVSINCGRAQAARGPHRNRIRFLENQLLRDNEPLIRAIVDQLTGRAKTIPGKRMPYAMRMGGRFGLAAVDYEDAMQGGRVAFGKAIAAFDPSKGKIAGYFAKKALHELQWLETFATHVARAPGGKADQRPDVSLVGMPAENEALSDTWRGYVQAAGDLGGPTAVDGFTPEDLAEWEETGEWPESLEEWESKRERRTAAVNVHPEPIIYSVPRPSWETFVASMCVTSSSARSARGAVGDAYEAYCLGSGVEAIGRKELYANLANLGIRETRVRVGGPVRGLAGLRLTTKAAARKPVRRRVTRALTDYEKFQRIQHDWLAGRRPMNAHGAAAAMLTT